MFLLAPLGLLVVSLVLIFYISARKFNYLKKISTEHADVAENIRDFKGFILAMFFEFFDYFTKVDITKHKTNILLEFEKLLRRLRVWSLKLDNISNNLIHKIRATDGQDQITPKEIPAVSHSVDSVIGETNSAISKAQAHHSGFQSYNIKVKYDDLKKEEQSLIMEIAKNPRQPELYKALGNLYLQLNQLADARESFVSVIKLNPEMKGIKKKIELLEKVLDSTVVDNN